MRIHLKIALLVAAALIAVQAVAAALVYHFLPDWQTRGQFGDVFGVVNASFSGLAFAGIVYSILVQQKESSLNAASVQRSAMLSAMTVLVAAHTERARFLESRSSPDAASIQKIQVRLSELTAQLEAEIERCGSAKG